MSYSPRRKSRPLLETLERRQMLSATSIERVSIATDGTPADAHSDSARFSTDGRYVVFLSTADNLTPNDTPGHQSVFLRDRQTGTTTRVSVATDGVSQPDETSFDPAVSDNGRYIVFSSKADNLVAGDTEGYSDIFVYDAQTQTTRRVSVASDGTSGDYHSYSPSISSDGRYVAFLSDADNLVPNDTNGKADVFIYDTQTNTTRRVSVTSAGVQGDASSYDPVISGDGQHIAFLSDADNFVANDTNQKADVFVVDLTTSAIQRVSVTNAGVQGSGASGKISLSSDGRFVAFESLASDLVPGDNNNLQDIFVYDRNASTIQRVSANADGTPSTGVSSSPAISNDGRYIVYTWAPASSLQSDPTARSDIFLFDRLGLTTRRISTAPNEVLPDDSSDYPAISGDGRYIGFFSNATNLVPNDINGVGDVFVKDRLALPHAQVSGTFDNITFTPILAGSTTTQVADGSDFSVSDIAGSPLIHTFVISNVGVDNLRLTGTPLVTIDGVNASDFTLTSQPSLTTLGPDISTPFTVSFHPSSTGPRTARVTFYSNDASTVLYTFTITGIGIDSANATRMEITQNSTPVADSSTLSFGSILVASPAKILSLTLRNVSSQPFTLDPASLTNSTGFELASDLDSLTLTPGQTATLSLRMLTTIPGTKSALLTLTNTASDVRTATVNLAGLILAPVATILTGSTPLPSTGSLSLGSVLKGAAAITQTLTLRNDGNAPLTLGALTLPTGFSTPTTLPSTLAAGQSVSLILRLDSSVLGDKSGQFTLQTSDANNAPYTLNLAGSVVAPLAVITLDGAAATKQQSVSFPSSNRGQTGSTHTVTISNTGTAPLAVTRPTLPADYILATIPATSVNPGESTSFTVQISTTAAGTFAGTLTFTTSDPAAASFTLSLTGSVLAPLAVIKVDGAAASKQQSVSFHSVDRGKTGPIHTITISNTGTAPLTIGQPNLPAGYALLTSPASSINPGANTSFIVQINTSTAGSFTGTLSFTTSDPAASPFTLSLNGTVTIPLATLTTSSSVDFGATILNAPAATRTISIRNDGTAALILGAPSLPTGFSLTTSPSSSIAPGGSTSFVVSLPTHAVGSYSGSLVIPTNDAAGSVTVSLTGSIATPAKTGLSVDSVTLKQKPAGSVILGGDKSAKGSATVTLVNYNTSALAGSYTITVWATLGTTPNPATDKILGKLTTKLSLAVKGKSASTVNLVFPAMPTDNDYHLTATVTGAKVDSYYGTGSSLSKVRIEKAAAKLGSAVKGTPAPAIASLGAKLSLTALINNSGNIAVKGAASGDIYLSIDGTIDPGHAVKLGSATGMVLNLNPKATAKLPIKLTLPKTLPSTLPKSQTYIVVLHLTKAPGAQFLNNGLISLATLSIH